MIRIAVVGKIGSGKSFVAKSFKLPLFDADKEVALIYKKNNFFLKNLIRKFLNLLNHFQLRKKKF